MRSTRLFQANITPQLRLCGNVWGWLIALCLDIVYYIPGNSLDSLSLKRSTGVGLGPYRGKFQSP